MKINNFKKLKKRIKRHKMRLIKKAKAYGLYENFGQAEVRALHGAVNIDEFDYYDLPKVRAMIDEFEEWAVNYVVPK